MSWKDIPLVRPDDAAAVPGKFSSSFRERFVFLHDIPKGDAQALRYGLYKKAVTSLLSELPMNERQERLLRKIVPVSPEEALDSLAKDATRAGAKDVYEKIQAIRQSLSDSLFRKVLSPRGTNRNEAMPIHFWMQLGKGCTPYLRVWAGFRFGVCSPLPMSRLFLKKAALARREHETDCPHAESGYSKVSFDGRVYAVAVESELRFLIPLSEAERIRYERAAEGSRLMNGARVRYALAPMLHEIVCPLGIELPFDPYLAGGLVKDASPLDLRM